MRRLAGVLTVLSFCATGAPEARAAGTCVYDAASKTVTAVADPAAMGFAALTVAGGGAISFDGTACGGATTANTTAVNIDANNRPALLDLYSPVTTTLITITETPGPTIRDLTGGTVNWTSGALSGNRSAADLDGDGIAEIVSSSTAMILDGVTGNDTLSGAGGFKTPGDEAVGPSVGFATLTGGTGDDTITGPGEINPGAGNDTIVAGTSGKTSLRYLDSGPTTGVRMKPDLSGTETGWDGFGGTDTYSGFTASTLGFDVVGTSHADIIYGGPGDNQVQSGNGADQVFGLGGNDTLRGGLGADELHGGEGNDTVVGFQPGAPGTDTANILRGGPGRDILQGSNEGDDFGPVLDNEVDTVSCYGGTDTGRADAGDVLHDCEFQAPPTLTVAPASLSVDEGATKQFTLTLSEALPFGIEVDVLGLDGTATSGSDFTPLARRVTIPAGQTTATVDVAALADEDDEPSQTFTFALANPSPAPTLGPNATVTIVDKSTPVTRVTVGPDPGTGAGGTYLAPPTVAVTAPTFATEMRCVLDPAAVPAAFADLPAGECPYLGAGQKVSADGTHTLCAASTSTSTGDTSAVACATWTTDATPPVVTCGAAPSYNAGEAGKVVTASVTDATSGAAAATVSAPADTATSGEKTATLVGQDKAGNSTTTKCAYSVASVAPTVTCGAAPSFNVGDAGKFVTASVRDTTSGAVVATASAPADTATSGEKTATLVGRDKAGNSATARCAYSVSSVALCGQPLVLLTVQLAGRKVELGGLAAQRYAGQTVTLKASGKRVGTATVGLDGSFALRVKAPKPSKRSKAKYQATLPDGSSTRKLRLTRSLVITRRSGNTVHGKVIAKKAKRPKRVVFYRQSTCTTSRVFGRAKVSRSGAFKLTLAGPTSPESIALYRVKAALGKGATYTVPIVVTPSASR